jgi:AcrR family transcriptional regulator
VSGSQVSVASSPVLRRRGQALEDALLEAAWEELGAVGYQKLTIEAVAERAGTSRAVFYRRWRNRHELVIAVLRRYRPMLSGEVPDTGSLREDVLSLLRRMSDRMNDVGAETIWGMLADYMADTTDFEGTQEQVLNVGLEVMTTIISRAQARGEARPGVSARVARIPTDLFRNELFRLRTPPSEGAIAEIVDQVFMPLVSSPSG